MASVTSILQGTRAMRLCRKHDLASIHVFHFKWKSPLLQPCSAVGLSADSFEPKGSLGGILLYPVACQFLAQVASRTKLIMGSVRPVTTARSLSTAPFSRSEPHREGLGKTQTTAARGKDTNQVNTRSGHHRGPALHHSRQRKGLVQICT